MIFICKLYGIFLCSLLTDRLAILCRAALNQEMDLNIVNLDGQRVLHSRFQATEGVHYIADIPHTYLTELISSVYQIFWDDSGTILS
ncbi:MAG: hypothetical protein IPK61_08090 [Saprospiraceae bacterium]|nr:hypothetical protein [Saprospiraceae bacterium]MBK8153006.1 hypothetical protein [Saprospiraceae bacterium]